MRMEINQYNLCKKKEKKRKTGTFVCRHFFFLVLSLFVFASLRVYTYVCFINMEYNVYECVCV